MNKLGMEYSDLKKVINVYIDDYPTPTRIQNDIMLHKLSYLDKTSVEYQKLRDTMVLSNGGFAMRYVMKYFTFINDNAAINDLFQEAVFGIMEAIDAFNIELKIAFTTYAYFHVKKRLIDYIKKNKLVRAPRDIARNIKHVNTSLSRLTGSLQRHPNTMEIRRDLEKVNNIILDLETIDNILNLIDLTSCDHADTFISEFKDQQSFLEYEDELFRLLRLNIDHTIKNFTPRLKKAIELRFGIGLDNPHELNEIKLMLTLSEEELEELRRL